MFLQSALRPSILDNVLCRDPQPSSYNEWKTAVRKSDQNLWNSAATCSCHSNPSSNPSRRQNSSFMPFAYRNSNSSKTTNAGPNATQTPTNPRAETTTPKTRNTAPASAPNPNNVSCWKCNGPHYSIKCPLNSTSNPKLRALIEHFDEIDAAYETAFTGAESIRGMLDSVMEEEDSECRTILECLVSEHPVFVGHDE